MAKFQNLLCLLCGAAIATTAFSHEIPDMQAGMNESLIANESASKSAQETPGSEPATVETGSAAFDNNAGVQLDRSGIGRASVHLQILQQSNQHFNADGNSNKKPVDEKRNNLKPAQPS